MNKWDRMRPKTCEWAGIPWYKIVPFLQHNPASGVITPEKINWMWALLCYISNYHSGGFKRSLQPSSFIQCVNSPTTESQPPLAWNVATVQQSIAANCSMAGTEHSKQLHLKMPREQQEGEMKLHNLYSEMICSSRWLVAKITWSGWWSVIGMAWKLSLAEKAALVFLGTPWHCSVAEQHF